MDDLNRIPIKTIDDTTIYIKDVAWVHNGSPPQTNIVRVNGQRSVLLTIQKGGSASTLSVIAGVKSILPQIATTVPSQLKMQPLADQSIFVKGAISGVVREALIAACLTALMILIFLGSWRSTSYRNFDSARDSDLRYCVERARRNDQHHDAGRVGPGSGNSRR